jgi:hypothetical protein
MMHGRWKSDLSIVPGKPPNNAEFMAAEAVEGRGGAKGNAVLSSRPSANAAYAESLSVRGSAALKPRNPAVFSRPAVHLELVPEARNPSPTPGFLVRASS